jgi:hypothetical protein
VTLGLIGGWNTSTLKPSNRKQDSTYFSFGVTLNPHRTMAITLDYSGQWAKGTGGDRPDTSVSTTSGNASLSYQPFSNLYLFASIGRTSGGDQPGQTVQEYSVGWQPFQGAPLQFTFAYSEQLRSSDNARVRVFSPILAWRITERAQLNVSYNMANTTGAFERSDSNMLSVNFRTAF